MRLELGHVRAANLQKGEENEIVRVYLDMGEMYFAVGLHPYQSFAFSVISRTRVHRYRDRSYVDLEARPENFYKVYLGNSDQAVGVECKLLDTPDRNNCFRHLRLPEFVLYS